MSTKTITKVRLIDEKLNELKNTIAVTKTSDTISKNTRGTKLYALGRERRVLHLIRSLIETNPDVKLSADDQATFVLLTTLATERTVGVHVEVKEGDSILGLLERYKDTKDIAKKITAACEKTGLKQDFATGKIVARAVLTGR